MREGGSSNGSYVQALKPPVSLQKADEAVHAAAESSLSAETVKVSEFPVNQMEQVREEVANN